MMSSLSCLFLVQGNGRGHLTQALALRAMLARAGHRVCSVLVGGNEERSIPAFFLNKIDAPVAYLDSPHFVYNGTRRAIRPMGTLLCAAWRSPRFRKSLRTIDDHIRRHQPDVVINFFEPLAGLYYALRRPALPMVCIAHQYFFLHPAHRFPPGHLLHRTATSLYTRLTAIGAARKLALSLYPVPDFGAQETGVTVVPPLLREEVLNLPLSEQEPFLLAYLLTSGYADEIKRWHARNPDTVLHCFWDNPDAAEIEAHSETLTFHRLDDENFLALMARCRGLITTAGFESIGEAMYLGKPVLAVPIEGHFEQYCNSLDVIRAGAGLAADHFDIDGFLHFLPHYQSPALSFRSWIAQAESCFITAVEAAISPVAVPASHAKLVGA